MSTRKPTAAKQMTSNILECLGIDRDVLVSLPIIELRKIVREKSRFVPYKRAMDMETILARERRRLKKLVYAESDKEKYKQIINGFGGEIDQLQAAKLQLQREKDLLKQEINYYYQALHNPEIKPIITTFCFTENSYQ